MFIASLTYKVELSEVDKHLDAHVAYLKKYYALNKFIVSGRKIPRTGGIIIADFSTEAELNAVLKEDPFCIADVADYDITEFTPTMAGKAFSALINDA